MQTMTTKKFSRVSSRGNEFTVFSVNAVEHNGTFAGRGRAVRTFALVCGQEVECEAGRAFTAAACVEKAGF